MPKLDWETEEEHERGKAALLYFAHMLQNNKPEDDEEEAKFQGNSCMRFRFALFLTMQGLEAEGIKIPLSYFWYAEGPVFCPEQIEEYTDGLIKWNWNENGECERCLDRDQCYDRHLRGERWDK